MKLNKSLVVVVVLGAFVAQVVVSGPAQSAPTEHVSSGSSSSEDAGLLDWVMLPIKTTIESVRRFFVGRANDLSTEVNSIESAAFQVFTQLYNRTYSPEELPHRIALFLERRQLIDESAKLFEQGRVLFKMAENRFIDRTRQEIDALKGLSMPPGLRQDARDSSGNEGGDRNKKEEEEAFTTTPIVARVKQTDDSDGDENMTVKYSLPAAADWRSGGCISPPDDQDQCGACYAFSIVNAIEAKRCINKGYSPHLSAQHIIDCASAPVRPEYHVNGCDGGWPTHVLNYLQSYNVVARDSCYRYVKRKGNYCRMHEMHLWPGCTLAASPLDTHQLQFKVLHNEQDVLWALYHVGPVVSIMQATDPFLYYSRGIFDDPNCKNKDHDADHTVLIVGYGEQGGVPYWVVKNSWGVRDWGEQGYARVRRGVNACSIGKWAWSITS